jgi:hypothetical protein
MFRVFPRSLLNGFVKVARVNKFHSQDIVSELSRAVSSNDSGVVVNCLERAISLARENDLSIKEFSLIMHQLGKGKGLLEESSSSCLDRFLNELKIKLIRNNRKFVSHSTPLDIALLLNGLVRVNKVPNTVKVIALKICEEVPLKLSLLEDHQLAQVMHALARLKFVAQDHPVVMEILREIVTSRDVSCFNSQTIVMLVSAVSRVFKSDSDKILHSFWKSVITKLASVPASDMQPNWPDVILSAVAHSGVEEKHKIITKKFVDNMVLAVEKQAKGGLIPQGRVLKAIDALLRIPQSCPHSISKLRKLCDSKPLVAS